MFSYFYIKNWISSDNLKNIANFLITFHLVSSTLEQEKKRREKKKNTLPIRPYDKNLLTDVRARPVIGPVVSSERITSRKGLRNTLGSTSERSRIKKDKSLGQRRAIQPNDINT